MLENKTSKKKIINRVKIADNFFSKLKGLMFENKKNFDYALIFKLGKEQKIGASIHMLFVFFPIDLIYLDKNKRVVEIAKNIKPFTLNYTPKKAAAYIIELPVGLTKLIKIGDFLEWDETH